MKRGVEAFGLGVASMVVGGLATLPLGLAPVGAAVAGANGLISGWLGVYDLGSKGGWWAWIRDCTWALPNVAGGLTVFFAQTFRRDRGYLAHLSERQNRIAFGGGWRLRKGFATTIGHVVVNAYDRQVLAPEDPIAQRRALLVTRHEHHHIRQARRYGIAFPVGYLGYMLFGLWRAIWWELSGDDSPFASLVMTSAYYLNPFERSAYRRDGYWPPVGMLAHRVPN